MIEIPIEISKMLRAIVPQKTGGRVIIDSRSVYDQERDYRAFLIIQRTESDKIAIFHFDISDRGDILREDFLIMTSPNLTTFNLIDHEVFKSDDAVCGSVNINHLETLEVQGKPITDSNGRGLTLLYSSEALTELITVIENAWKYQKSQGRFNGNG